MVRVLCFVSFMMCIFQRRACNLIGQPLSPQRRNPNVKDDEGALNSKVIRLASKYGRYGYRRIPDLCKKGRATGGWITSGWNASDAKRGLRSSRSSLSRSRSVSVKWIAARLPWFPIRFTRHCPRLWGPAISSSKFSLTDQTQWNSLSSNILGVPARSI